MTDLIIDVLKVIAKHDVRRMEEEQRESRRAAFELREEFNRAATEIQQRAELATCTHFSDVARLLPNTGLWVEGLLANLPEEFKKLWILAYHLEKRKILGFSQAERVGL